MTSPPFERLVVFLGAGFSAHAGIPMMMQFGDHIRQRNLLKDDQADFDHIQNECNAMAETIGQTSRNLEQLASFLSVLNLSRPDYQFQACKTYSTPEKALQLVIRALCQAVSQPMYESAAQKAHKFLMTFTGYRKVTIVTTNYDWLLELGVWCAMRSGRGPKGLVLPSLTYSSLISSSSDVQLYKHSDEGAFPKLLRLHGAANWYLMNDGQIKVDGHARYVHGQRVFVGVSPDEQHFYKPGLIPPVAIKAMDSDLIKEQWQEAASDLSEADTVWFLGYSFPESDSYMRYFLSGALAGNSRLCNLVVVDPDRRVLADRAPQIFKGAHLQSVLKRYPVPWEWIDHDALLLNGDWRPRGDEDWFYSARDSKEAKDVFGPMGAEFE